jgi:hypothetical protein
MPKGSGLRCLIYSHSKLPSDPPLGQSVTTDLSQNAQWVRALREP